MQSDRHEGWTDLSEDILFPIFLLLPANYGVQTISLVCSQWRTIINSSNYWEAQLKETFSITREKFSATKPPRERFKMHYLHRQLIMKIKAGDSQGFMSLFENEYANTANIQPEELPLALIEFLLQTDDTGRNYIEWCIYLSHSFVLENFYQYVNTNRLLIRDYSDLALATLFNQIETMQDLIAQSPQQIDAGAGLIGDTPLTFALRCGHRAAAELLLTKGANPNAVPVTINPLILAIKRGDIDLVRMLLNYHAELNNDENNKIGTPLIVAIRSRYLEIARLLLHHGADIYQRHRLKHSALHAALKTKDLALIKFVHDHMMQSNGHYLPFIGPFSLLSFKISKWDENLVHYLLVLNLQARGIDNADLTQCNIKELLKLGADSYLVKIVYTIPEELHLAFKITTHFNKALLAIQNDDDKIAEKKLKACLNASAKDTYFLFKKILHGERPLLGCQEDNIDEVVTTLANQLLNIAITFENQKCFQKLNALIGIHLFSSSEEGFENMTSKLFIVLTYLKNADDQDEAIIKLKLQVHNLLTGGHGIPQSMQELFPSRPPLSSKTHKLTSSCPTNGNDRTMIPPEAPCQMLKGILLFTAKRQQPKKVKRESAQINFMKN